MRLKTMTMMMGSLFLMVTCQMTKVWRRKIWKKKMKRYRKHCLRQKELGKFDSRQYHW